MKSEIQVQRRPSRTNDSTTSRSSSPASTIVVKKEDDQSLSLSPFPPSPSSNPSTPLTTWPYSALLTPQSLISPSQLIVKRSSSPDQLSLTTFPAKKIKRKARTDEEKEVRAYERTMRNRRAAQESRDRKKRQFEALEEENKRLHVENKKMKQRIKQLEQQHTPHNLALDVPLSPLPQSNKCETLDSDLESESCASTSPATSFVVVKQEDPESLDLEEMSYKLAYQVPLSPSLCDDELPPSHDLSSADVLFDSFLVDDVDCWEDDARELVHCLVSSCDV